MGDGKIRRTHEEFIGGFEDIPAGFSLFKKIIQMNFKRIGTKFPQSKGAVLTGWVVAFGRTYPLSEDFEEVESVFCWDT